MLGGGSKSQVNIAALSISYTPRDASLSMHVALDLILKVTLSDSQQLRKTAPLGADLDYSEVADDYSHISHDNGYSNISHDEQPAVAYQAD